MVVPTEENFRRVVVESPLHGPIIMKYIADLQIELNAVRKELEGRNV